MANNNILKQYAAISSKWVSDNPVRAFLPFFYGYIYEKCSGQAISFDKFRDGISSYWGFKFSYHLIEATLSYLEQVKEASVDKDNYWSFKLNEKNQHPHIIGDSDSQCSRLIECFKQFLINFGKDISNLNLERMLISFFANYDNDIIVNNSSLTEISKSLKKGENDYLVACFINEIKDTDQYLFSFILQIVRGSIIKSALFFNKYSLKCMKHQTYYLDTGVVFRLLGFYGEYYEKEYLQILNNLKKHCKKVCITQFVLSEIERILDVCKNFVECGDCDPCKSPEILYWFREKNKTSKEITDIIVTLEERLKSIGTEIENVSKEIKNYDEYHENFDVLKKSIEPIYSRERCQDGFNEALETDLNSILHVYSIYGGASIREFIHSEAFFVTTNSALVSKVSEYHRTLNKKCIIPLIDDRFLGLLLSNGNMNGEEVEKLSLLAFCEKCQKPSDEAIKKYCETVDELKKRKEITDDEAFNLKNYDFFDDALMKGYVKNGYVANRECVFIVRDEITKKILEKEEQKHQQALEQKDEEYRQKLRSKEDELSSHKIKLEERKKELKEKAHRKNKVIIKSIYYTFFGIFCCACIILAILSVISLIKISSGESTSVGSISKLIFEIIGVGSSLFFILYPLIKKEGKIAKIINALIGRLDKKSDYKIDDLFKMD